MSRPSVPNVIFDHFMSRFESDGWRIKKSLITRAGPLRDLAWIDLDRREITVCPVLIGERDDPPAKNLFHEIVLHLGLGFGPEIDRPVSEDGKRIEDWWWKQLSTTRKARLAKLLE